MKSEDAPNFVKILYPDAFCRRRKRLYYVSYNRPRRTEYYYSIYAHRVDNKGTQYIFQGHEKTTEQAAWNEAVKQIHQMVAYKLEQ